MSQDKRIISSIHQLILRHLELVPKAYKTTMMVLKKCSIMIDINNRRKVLPNLASISEQIKNLNWSAVCDLRDNGKSITEFHSIYELSSIHRMWNNIFHFICYRCGNLEGGKFPIYYHVKWIVRRYKTPWRNRIGPFLILRRNSIQFISIWSAFFINEKRGKERCTNR